MNIPFLHHLQSLTGPPLNKIVGVAPAGPGRANAESLLRRVLDGLPELVAAAVGEVADGRLLASYTSSKDFDPAKIIGFNAAVLRQQQQALKALGLSEQQEQLTELLITLRRQLHLLRLLPDGRRFLYVAVDCHDTNLAIAREVMRSCDT